MEVGPLVVLGLMWVVLNALRRGGGKPSDRQGPPPSRPASPRLPQATRSGAVPPARAPGSTPPLDATQREGSRLEQVLRELGRTLDQAGGSTEGTSATTRPPGTATRSAGSIEPAPEGLSLEEDSARGERAVVDQDDEAERVVEQRLAAVEANQKPLSEADHRTFDQRIRQEPADKTATRAYTAKQLRQAMVWREILGPPVSLRGEDSEER